MNVRRLLTAFLVALLLSGACTWWLGRRVHASSTGVPVAVRHIIVTSKPLQAGQVLSATTVQTIDWPSTQTLPGSFGNLQDLSGRVLLQPLVAGEPILAQQLAPVGAAGGFVAKIPHGMRAISLRADEASGVSGFLQPNSVVDVLATSRSPVDASFQSFPVAQNVRVLAVGQRSEPSQSSEDTKPGAFDTVTLLVTADDAARLANANAQGKLMFVLRNDADHAVLDVPANNGPTPKPASVASKPSPPVATRSVSVETITGGKQSVQTFEGRAQ